MEKRNGKLIVGTAGGTASKGAKTYKVSLPSSWVAQLGLDGAKKEIELQFDGNQVLIRKKLSGKDFAEQKIRLGHDVKLLRFYDAQTPCTTIYADFTDQTLAAENHTEFIVKTAFGHNMTPTWDDLNAFLEERCIPRQRAGLQDYLEALGLSHYDPLAIIQHTKGRMAEDQQWMAVEDLK